MTVKRGVHYFLSSWSSSLEAESISFMVSADLFPLLSCTHTHIVSNRAQPPQPAPFYCICFFLLSSHASLPPLCPCLLFQFQHSLYLTVFPVSYLHPLFHSLPASYVSSPVPLFTLHLIIYNSFIGHRFTALLHTI